MFNLFLVAHLLIEDYKLALDDSPLGELSVEFVLDLRSLDLLDLRRVFLQLLRHFLEYLSLFLQLIKYINNKDTYDIFVRFKSSFSSFKVS